MRVLVDTNVWSAALRRRGSAPSPVVRELRRLIQDRLVDIIGPIRQEVLSGIRDASHFSALEEYLADFQDLDLATEDYVTAARFFNVCRAAGIQGSHADFLICAVAVRYGLAVFTLDGDFSNFEKHVPIALYGRQMMGTI